VSYLTKPRPIAELAGLVYGASPIPEEHDDHWYQKPVVWACVVFVVFLALNIIFW
jgi:SSS family solute:Na+ symporter